MRGSFHLEPKRGCMKRVAGIAVEELPCLDAVAEVGSNTD